MNDNYVGFAGTFDGQGYTISNLTIDKPTSWGQGLFGYNTNKTTVIKNFTINNVNINAEDTSGAVGGYFTYGTFENIKVTGDVSIKGATHMGGIVGNGYYTNVLDCSVVAKEGSYITTTTNGLVGGIVGYHGWGQYEISNCTVKNLSITGTSGVGAIAGIVGAENVIEGCVVENVTLTKTGIENLPSVGAAAGCWDANSSKSVTITNNTFKNITLNGKYTEVKEYEFNEVFGTPYSGGLINGGVVESNNVKENIVNNLEKNVKTIKVETEQEFSDAIANVTSEVVIDATGLVIDFSVKSEYSIPTGVTLKGIKFYSTAREGNIVYTTEGAGEKVVFENCIFDRNQRSYLMTVGSDGTCKSMEFNNCEFKGAFNLSFYAYDQGVATYNNCKFTCYDNLEGYIVCMAGYQYLYNCEFDYTNAATGDFGALKRKAVNASGTDNRHCYVELNSCTLINTITYNANGGNIVRK